MPDAVLREAPDRLETAQLVLRRFCPGDLDDLERLCRSPAVERYFGYGVPYGREGAVRLLGWYLGHWEMRGYGVYAVQRREDAAFVGLCGLIWPERNAYCGPDEFYPELTWALGEEWRGRGYAAEAAQAVLDMAFTELGYPVILCLIEQENTASLRAAERLGAEKLRALEVKGYPNFVLRFLPGGAPAASASKDAS
jgi:[ribosomal protein S5]-alanine N-acetyltransferase